MHLGEGKGRGRECLQCNLRTRDTLGLIVLSLVERYLGGNIIL